VSAAALWALRVTELEDGLLRRAEAFGMNGPAAVEHARRLCHEGGVDRVQALLRVGNELMADWLAGWGKAQPEHEG